ncbi:MAG: MFS transporter [Gammaproteobacteria bacterium]
MPAKRLSVLRHPAMRALLAARLAGTIAAQILSTVVGWQVFAISHSPLALGYVGLAQFVPIALLILPAGTSADRFNRKSQLMLAWLLAAAVSALFVVLAIVSSTHLLPFFGLLALFGIARAFAGPALSSLVPLLVPDAELGAAVALNSAAFQVSVIAGPAVGGALYILGPDIAYGVSFALFVVAVIAALCIHPTRAQKHDASPASGFTRFVAGIAYVRSHPVLLGAISLDLFAVLFGGATALLPIYASEILAVGPVGLGALRSAMAIGAFVVGLWLGRRPLDRHAGRIMFACVAVFGLATILFGLSRSFPLSMIALVIAGAADMVSVYVRSTLVLIATPDEMRGRVSAVNSLFVGTSNELGEFESGITAGWFGAVPAVVIGGIGTLAVTAIWMWRFPALRKVSRLSCMRPDAQTPA